MKKTLKRVLSLALALMFVVGGLVVLPQEAKAAEYEAKLGYANADWSVQEWGDNAKTTVTGAGTYSVSWNLPEGTAVNGALVFVVDVAGAAADLAANGQKFNLTDLKVKADDKELAVDLSKVVTGDIEEKGNYRIEIYNEYGTTKENSPIDVAAVVASKNVTVEFTLEVVADGYATKLGYANADWSVQEWGDNASTVVKGAGTYSVSWNLPEGTAVNGALVFVVDVAGAAADLAANGQQFKLTDLKVKADDKDLTVDLSKVQTGDIEEKGNYRIEIYNEYGLTKENSPIDVAAVVASKNVTIEFTLEVVAAEGGDVEPEPEPTPSATFDPAGKYNAYLGLQTPNWTYRNAWNDAGYETNPDLWGNFIYGNETGEKYGVVTDAKVEGNGTYTVSLKDFGTIIADDFETASQDYFNLLFISTDIPLSDDIKITDVKLIIDGKTVHTDAEAFLDGDDTEYVKILIQNIWNSEKAEISYYNAPSKSVEMQFTISGFNYDKAADEPADTEADSQPASDDKPADKNDGGNNILPIVIGVVVVVAVAAVVVVVAKKNKKAE